LDDQLDTVDNNLIREQVRDFIRTNFLYDNAASFDDSASLSELGILDETGALELVMFVEETYGLVVEDADLLPENFDTVANVTTFVADRLRDRADQMVESGSEDEG
jgi:acyl carrier protein